jgi:NAD(P)-dependent dehydrogenase (short-subunit alcohol dehydrogenase family)
MRLQEKVAIITGAGSGMGRVAEGAKVIVAEFDEAAGSQTVGGAGCGR